MMHTTTTTATAVSAARSSSSRARPLYLCLRATTTVDLAAYTGGNGTIGLVRAWSLLYDMDVDRVVRTEDAYRHIRNVEAIEAGANFIDIPPKAVLVAFVRGDERFFAELGGLVPSDAEVERDLYGEARLVPVAVEG